MTSWRLFRAILHVVFAIWVGHSLDGIEWWSTIDRVMLSALCLLFTVIVDIWLTHIFHGYGIDE